MSSTRPNDGSFQNSITDHSLFSSSRLPRARGPPKAPGCPRSVQQCLSGPMKWKENGRSNDGFGRPSLTRHRTLWPRVTGAFLASGSEETHPPPLGLPARTVSSDLDCCLLFSLSPRPPLGLAGHGRVLVPVWALGTAPRESWGAGARPGERRARELPAGPGGRPRAALCGLLVQRRPTSNPTLGLADGKKKRNEVCSLFSRNGPRDPRLGSPLGLFPF